MALTPAQRHFRRAKAAKNSLAAGQQPKKQQTGDQYELMMAALYEARRTLKDIKSVENKIEKKRELLPQFTPYVEGVLNSGTGAQDDVLMTCMIWYLDVGQPEGALEIAEYAIKHGLQTPDKYERDTASLVAEQMADEALKVLADLEGDESAEPCLPLLDCLVRTDQITAGADMHDQIRAKLHKALGYANRQCGRLEEARNHLQRALQLNDRVGVKKDLDKLERELKQQNEGNSQS